MRTFTQRKGLWEEEAEGKVKKRALSFGQSTDAEGTSSSCSPGWYSWGAPDKLMQETPGERRAGAGVVPRSTDLRDEELRRVDRINHEAGKCLALPHFVLCMDGGSPRLEQVCTMLLLKLSQMLFSSGRQDSHPLSWPTPAAWSIFSEWIKINTM